MTELSDVRLSLARSIRRGGLGRIIVDLFKYGIASLGALALDAGTMVFLNKALGVNYLVAAAIGFTSGLGLVYWLSVRYVFGDIRRLRPSQEIFGFLVTGLIGLLLNEILMKTFVEQVGLSVPLAKVPTAGFVFLFNFTARRMLLFSDVAKTHLVKRAATAWDLALKSSAAEFPLWGSALARRFGGRRNHFFAGARGLEHWAFFRHRRRHARGPGARSVGRAILVRHDDLAVRSADGSIQPLVARRRRSARGIGAVFPFVSRRSITPSARRGWSFRWRCWRYCLA